MTTNIAGAEPQVKPAFGGNANVLDGLKDEITARRIAQKAGNGRHYIVFGVTSMLALYGFQVNSSIESKASFAKSKLLKVASQADKLAGKGNSSRVAEFLKTMEINRETNRQTLGFLGNTLLAASGNTLLDNVHVEMVDQGIKVRGSGQSFSLGQAYGFTSKISELLPKTTATLTSAEKRATLSPAAVSIQFEIIQQGVKP